MEIPFALPPEFLQRVAELANNPMIRNRNIHTTVVGTRVEMVWQYDTDPVDVVRSTGWQPSLLQALRNAELQIKKGDN